MPQYRIFFRRGSDIVGRQDYDADDDRSAWWIGVQLCEACGDQCERFEIWEGTRRLAAAPSPSATVADVIGRSQRRLVEVEEAIRRSEWSIRQSARLLQRLNALRESLPPPDVAG